MANRWWPPPLLRAPEPQPEQRGGQVTPWGDWGTSYNNATGVSVNPSSASQLLTVYGCVSLISDTIATLPVDVYRRADGVPVEVAKPRWLEQPNEYTTLIEFITQTLWSLLLEGNAYWVYGQNVNKVPSDLYCIDPATVDVRARARTGRDPYAQGNGAIVEYFINGQQFTGNLLHIRGIMRPGALKGLSPVEAARQSIGLGLAAQEFAARFYSNGAVLTGTIETEADLTGEQARDLQNQWASAHSGLQNAHRPGVLDNGAHWNPTTVTPAQAQFLETRAFSASEIAGQLFLLDPTMLGIPISTNSLTYANLEQRGIHLVQFTLLRWIVRVEKAFTSLLAGPQYVKFQVAGLERADLKTRYEAEKVAIDAGILLTNEAREKEELPQLPDQLKVSTSDAETIGALIRAGYEADSVVSAVTTGNLKLLVHTGYLPVTIQGQPPAPMNAPPFPPPAGNGAQPATVGAADGP